MHLHLFSILFHVYDPNQLSLMVYVDIYLLWFEFDLLNCNFVSKRQRFYIHDLDAFSDYFFLIGGIVRIKHKQNVYFGFQYLRFE